MLGRVKKTGACVCQLTELRWNDQREQGALANARQPLVPARNHLRVSHTWGVTQRLGVLRVAHRHLSPAQCELERLPSLVRRVEFASWYAALTRFVNRTYVMY